MFSLSLSEMMIPSHRVLANAIQTLLFTMRHKHLSDTMYDSERKKISRLGHRPANEICMIESFNDKILINVKNMLPFFSIYISSVT